MIHTGDCIEVMATMPADSVDAVVTDPPYNLAFMSREWDRHVTPATFQAWCEQWGREALRVTKPGGYLLAFGGTRTHHRLVCGLEDAGWIIRDELDWIYACLSDDTELLTLEQGWVRYNRASEGDHAAAFDPATGELRWERIEAVHQYCHDGPLAEVGPSLVTLNHRVITDAETARVPRLPRLWDELPASVGLGQEDSLAVVFPSLQRGEAYPRPTVSARQGMVAREAPTAVGVHEGLRESGLEGRSYRVQEAWELLGSAIREGADVGIADGPQGWLRDGASSTDGAALRLLAHADRMREPREPRPDRQPSRESDAVARQPDPQALRMGQGNRGDGLPPGDTPRLVDYAGVVWCITVPSGAFVARRGGVAFVTGNSGFPKGKANLKPAHEPIVLARKPGPLRPLGIDETRIGYQSEADKEAAAALQALRTKHPGGAPTYGGGKGMPPPTEVGVNNAGRWPSNVLLSDPELFDSANPFVVGSGAVQSGGGNPPRRNVNGDGGYSGGWSGDDTGLEPFDTSGGYSRFFIVPKADRADREPVLRGQADSTLETGHGPAAFVVICAKCNRQKVNVPGAACKCEEPEWVRRSQKPRENAHPTVKPTDLMRHLVRLVTPSSGTVLDPFLGSGSTALACELEGFPWIGIEKEPEYVAIAEARLNGTQRGMGLDVPAPTRKAPNSKSTPGWNGLGGFDIYVERHDDEDVPA